jgi:hypothetical protein
MAERQKSPREVRKFPFDLTAQMSAGASLTTVQGFASRKQLQSTTLAAAAVPDDPTVLLNANPGVGALLIVHPNDPVFEETLKVTNVTPSAGDFLCAVEPTIEQNHGINTPVDYEEGLNTPLLVTATPTPDSTTIVHLTVQQGADGQDYRFTVRGICNNGERVEEGDDVTVVEFAPTTTITKEPTEVMDVPVDFSEWTQFYSITLSSAIAFVARESQLDNTTVSGDHLTKGVTTLTIAKHPGIGALLTVGAAPERERFLVSAVSGTGPYACTVSPLQFTHGNGQAITFHPGTTTRLLQSTSIQVAEAIFRIRLGAAGQDYLLVALGTLSDGQIAQKTTRIEVREE